MRLLFLMAALGVSGATQAHTLYRVCKGAYVEFSFVGEGDSTANVSIQSAKLSIAGRSTMRMAPTDGLYANSVTSFKLGSSVYSGDVLLHQDGSFELTEPGLSEKATCTTNLFDGKIVEVEASQTFESIPYINQVKAKAKEMASRLCPGDPMFHPNIALIGSELLEGYQTEIIHLPGGSILVKVHAQFRCLSNENGGPSVLKE